MTWRILLLFVAQLVGANSVQGQNHAQIDLSSIIMCEGLAGGNIPSFSEPNCRAVHDQHLSIYKELVWLKLNLNVSDTLINSGEPLGLYLSAKGSSTVYINGQFLGKNGEPSTSVSEETPGKMDTIFFLPNGAAKIGQNELIIEMSGHHGFLQLSNPIHWIAIGPYANPTRMILHDYLPSFLPLGVLIAGALYFSFLLLKQKTEKHLLLVPIMAFFASAQLIAEVSRGVFAYEYPIQDIRLITILVCALASGFCLLLHITVQFLDNNRWFIFTGLFVTVLLAVSSISGFDNKSLAALQFPALAGVAICGHAWLQSKAQARLYSTALLLFSAAIQFSTSQFLDVYFYYVVASLLLFLFAQQIQILANEKEQGAMEKARADRLQIILAEKEESMAPSTLTITQAGKVEVIPTDQVCFCKGARDYVEVIVLGKGSLLQNSTLGELEKELPATFLRVHRSYIVNSSFIQTLERGPSGSGNLLLTSGEKIPVSRRIMSDVRKALN